MKHPYFWAAFGIFAFLSGAALSQGRWGWSSGFEGGAYLCTVMDSNGTFSSRSVITLHPDHTMSVIDSGQQGPNFFSSQRGSWKPERNGRIVARAIDFVFPQSGSGIGRTDFAIAFSQNRKRVTGAIRVTIFRLDEDPLESEGIILGDFTFAGLLIEPR